MGLDWCKLLDTESGWVSDNYLAFDRIVKWYYSPLSLLDLDTPYVEPLNPVKMGIADVSRLF